jgi:myosin heavy subunit
MAPGVEETHDLARQESIDEAGLNTALEARFRADLIYTYVGDILIAINPYKALRLYEPHAALQYTNIANKADFPPHIFAIADAAFAQMMRNRQPQVAPPVVCSPGSC